MFGGNEGIEEEGILGEGYREMIWIREGEVGVREEVRGK